MVRTTAGARKFISVERAEVISYLLLFPGPARERPGQSPARFALRRNLARRGTGTHPTGSFAPAARPLRLLPDSAAMPGYTLQCTNGLVEESAPNNPASHQSHWS